MKNASIAKPASQLIRSCLFIAGLFLLASGIEGILTAMSIVPREYLPTPPFWVEVSWHIPHILFGISLLPSFHSTDRPYFYHLRAILIVCLMVYILNDCWFWIDVYMRGKVGGAIFTKVLMRLIIGILALLWYFVINDRSRK